MQNTLLNLSVSWITDSNSECDTSLSSLFSLWSLCTLYCACINRLFRVIPAVQFIEHFASDRSHMIDEEQTQLAHANGAPEDTVVYNHTVPSWDAIRGPLADSAMNLDSYISMEPSDESKYGTVYAFAELIRANI